MSFLFKPKSISGTLPALWSQARKLSRIEMDESNFKIIFLGDLVEADKKPIVIRNLAALFGSTAGTLDNLFERSPVVLKKNLSRDDAVRFRDAIVKCGAFCRIESMELDPASISPLDEDNSSEQLACPRCGKQQAKTPICRHCGALVQEFRRRAEAVAGDNLLSKEELNRRYYERRRDFETAVNVDESEERRKGRDRRRAHLNWRI